MMLLRSTALLALVLAAAASACAVSPATNEESATDSAELRALAPEEILGEIHYGDTVEIPYTSTPRYRAYWFTGTKGDWLDVGVTSSTGSIAAFVTDDAFRSVRRGTAAVLPQTGKYFIAVREGDLQPGTLTITFLRRTAPAGSAL